MPLYVHCRIADHDGEWLRFEKYEALKAAASKVAAHSPHASHCGMRVGDSEDACDCGLVALRRQLAEKRIDC